MATFNILSPFNDTVTGTPGSDTFYVWGGADIVQGGAGNDTFFDLGAFGSYGNGLSGDDQFFGGDGNDLFVAGDGSNLYDGGAGVDTVDYSFAHKGVTVILAQHFGLGDGSDTLDNIENVIGGQSADRITGDSGNNVLFGGAGNDILDGGGGNDILSSGTGNDTLRGGAGVNTADYSVFNSDPLSHVAVNLASGVTHKFGTVGVTSNGGLSGSVGVDSLSAISNAVGTLGNDTIVGNAGANVLTGGLGSDLLTGGLGADTFVYNSIADSKNNAIDVITDFQSGVDKIDLSGMDANAGLSGNQAFSFRGAGAFDNHAAELIYQVIQGSAFVRGDVNGDGVADFTIKLQNVTHLAATDFRL